MNNQNNSWNFNRNRSAESEIIVLSDSDDEQRNNSPNSNDDWFSRRPVTINGQNSSPINLFDRSIDVAAHPVNNESFNETSTIETEKRSIAPSPSAIVGVAEKVFSKSSTSSTPIQYNIGSSSSNKFVHDKTGSATLSQNQNHAASTSTCSNSIGSKQTVYLCHKTGEMLQEPLSESEGKKAADTIVMPHVQTVGIKHKFYLCHETGKMLTKPLNESEVKTTDLYPIVKIAKCDLIANANSTASEFGLPSASSTPMQPTKCNTGSSSSNGLRHGKTKNAAKLQTRRSSMPALNSQMSPNSSNETQGNDAQEHENNAVPSTSSGGGMSMRLPKQKTANSEIVSILKKFNSNAPEKQAREVADDIIRAIEKYGLQINTKTKRVSRTGVKKPNRKRSQQSNKSQQSLHKEVKNLDTFDSFIVSQPRDEKRKSEPVKRFSIGEEEMRKKRRKRSQSLDSSAYFDRRLSNDSIELAVNNQRELNQQSSGHSGEPTENRTVSERPQTPKIVAKIEISDSSSEESLPDYELPITSDSSNSSDKEFGEWMKKEFQSWKERQN